jgi:3-methylfumaryl-CoA hydratase
MHAEVSPPLSSYVESWAPGPVVEREPVLPVGPAAALSAVLDLPETVAGVDAPLPPLWQWLYFLSWPARSELGADGHPRDGHFLPPIPSRQRMWAGGRCEILEPLRLGMSTERISTLHTVTPKQGRTGEMLFVTERREFRQRGRACVVEEQDIVYRSGRNAAQHPVTLDESAVPLTDEPWRLPLHPDPALLFRFSALTANAHRIHYDAPYCRAEEGYPGLVVHGPLLALLMLELPRRHSPDRRVRSLAFRFHSPVFAGERLVACGTPSDDGAELRIATHRDDRHASAEVTFV